MTLPKLGIIAGSESLPQQIVDIYTHLGGEVFIASISQQPIIAANQQQFQIGQAGKILSYFEQNSVENVLMVGKIERPNLSSLKLDIMGSLLMAKILQTKIKGDDNLLRVVSEFIEQKGFRVISAVDILNLQTSDMQLQTINSPSTQDLQDIELGKNILQTLGSFDIGQSIIIHNGYVLGIEAAEGTDNLIARCADLRKGANDSNNGGVLVKMMKQTQDARLDTPVIGPVTAENLVKYGFNGVAVEKNKVIIADNTKIVSILNQHNLFLHYI